MANDTHAQSARVRWARLRFSDPRHPEWPRPPPTTASSRPASRRSPPAPGGTPPPASPSASRSRRSSAGGTSARGAQDPFAALARKVHAHAGTRIRASVPRSPRPSPASTAIIRDGLWQLHHDNLVALAREETPPSAPGTRLRHRVPLHARAGPRPGPQSAPPRARGRRAVRGSRDPLLRGRPRPWPLAPRLPPGLAPRAHRRRPIAKNPSCSASSTIAPGSAATCSGTSTRPQRHSSTASRRRSRSADCLAPCSPTTAQPCSPPRRAKRLRAPRRRPPHDAAVFPLEQNGKQESFWEQIEGRLPAHARGRARALARPAQHRHPGLGRGGVLSERSTPRSASPPHALPARTQRRPRKPQLRCTAARVPGLQDHTRPALAATAPSPPAACASRSLRLPHAPAAAPLRVARWDLSSVDLVMTRVPATPSPRSCPRQGHRNAERVRRVVAPAAPDEPSLPVGIAPHLRALPWPTTPPRDCPRLPAQRRHHRRHPGGPRE